MVSMGFYIVGKRVYEDYVNMLACICLLVYACLYMLACICLYK